MRPFKDLFKPVSEQEKQAIDQEMRQADMSLTALGDRARVCLATEDFKAYREQYVRTEAILINALLKYNEFFQKSSGVDISKYAMTISGYLTKLDTLRSMAEGIIRDAKKGPKANEQ